MRKPVARPTAPKSTPPAKDQTTGRAPKAFAPAKSDEVVRDFAEEAPTVPDLVAPAPTRRNWLVRIALAAGGLVVSLGLGLAADQLIRDLFARYDWLGWVGLTGLGLFVIALIALGAREALAISRLAWLDHVRHQAEAVHVSDKPNDGRAVLDELQVLYAGRPDLARARAELDKTLPPILDGADMVVAAERHLMSPLDARARALTAAASRRVAIVTAISPRALVDIAFVTYESVKLAGAIATLYGARPGLFGSWRLARAILGHLAVTGGVALGDSVVQQLLGHGLAARLSARLGEGLVNGLMTVRVGIAAMRVTRPLPFQALKQPVVMDFVPELAKVGKTESE